MNKQQTRGKRGVILTNQGFKRLQDAQQESENTDNYGVPLTIGALSDRTHLDPGTVSKVLHREVTVDKRTLERFFRTFGLELSKADYQKPDTVTNNSQEFTRYEQNQNWGNAPDITVFFGRTQELTLLQEWVVDDRCRYILKLLLRTSYNYQTVLKSNTNPGKISSPLNVLGLSNSSTAVFGR